MPNTLPGLCFEQSVSIVNPVKKDAKMSFKDLNYVMYVHHTLLKLIIVSFQKRGGIHKKFILKPIR